KAGRQEVVRAETPFGLNLERIDPRDALAPLSDDEQAGMVQRLAVVPAGTPPVRDAVRMRIRVDGVPGELLPPDGPAQRRSGNEYLLEQLPPPAPGGETEMITGPEAERHLRTDAFITVDHPKVRELAAGITGQEEDLWTRALRVHDWVYQNIEKTATMSMPSAVEVLRTRQGDCNEHSVLFAALARAAGVPARVAIGLAWSEALAAFGYHAWVEVYAGRWVPMDPTFGQPTADATHLKLFDGSLEEWPRLLGYVGNLKIEVLEVEGP
ncbi:MAG TPA: transglutaminase-like domain-containing protein, partial [Candidatus Hydrogenedentes bacterium]|nr:transglutaminase-like domain-containing protein [Candidatus Hydrogenedentota bacterium]